VITLHCVVFEMTFYREKGEGRFLRNVDHIPVLCLILFLDAQNVGSDCGHVVCFSYIKLLDFEDLLHHISGSYIDGTVVIPPHTLSTVARLVS
jgi:hypothetical protein